VPRIKRGVMFCCAQLDMQSGCVLTSKVEASSGEEGALGRDGTVVDVNVGTK
jgi:hypothetical protein